MSKTALEIVNLFAYRTAPHIHGQKVEMVLPVQVLPKQTKENVTLYSKTGKRYMGRKTPDKITVNAKAIGMLAKPYRPELPLRGPIRADIVFSSLWRNSDTKKIMRDGYVFHWQQPDKDNLEKQLFDVLQTEGFFEKGDAQIVSGLVTKIRSGIAFVAIVLQEMTGDKND